MDSLRENLFKLEKDRQNCSFTNCWNIASETLQAPWENVPFKLHIIGYY